MRMQLYNYIAIVVCIVGRDWLSNFIASIYFHACTITMLYIPVK